MKKLFKSFLILSAIAMAIPCFAQTPNTLTKMEKKAEIGRASCRERV